MSQLMFSSELFVPQREAAFAFDCFLLKQSSKAVAETESAKCTRTSLNEKSLKKGIAVKIYEMFITTSVCSNVRRISLPQ